MPKESKKITLLTLIRGKFQEARKALHAFFKVERRGREKKPLSIKLFIMFYCLIPAINYFTVAITAEIYPPYLDIVLEKMKLIEIIMNFLALCAGAGLLSSKKTGLVLCMAYTPILLVYKIVSFLTEASAYNFAAIFQIFFCVASIIFFTSREIYSPYLKKRGADWRGWRLHLRRPIRIALTVNDERLFTRDLCAAGFYAAWKDCAFKRGREVNVNFSVNKNLYELKAGIARIDPEGVALAFRSMDNKTKITLHRDLQLLEIKKEQKSSLKEEP